jgi:streptogramin lyase
VSSNDVLWCGAGSGFEKITSSGSSFISLPNTAYTVEGMTRGPDGNPWFTAESTARTPGQLALYGEIDETTGTVTTYQVPNPTSIPSSEVPYQIGAIASGPSSLYFETSVDGQTFVEAAGTSGSVTQSVKLYYANPAGLSLTYASDGNVWVVTGPFGTSGTASGEESYVTKVTLSGGAVTNYPALACAAPQSNLVQGGDGNLYVLALNGGRGVCTITTAGVATFTPISPYLQPIFDLTVATDGSVWYAVPKGVGRIYGGTIIQYSDPTLHDVSQGVFALPNGTLWEIGTFPSSEMVQVLNPSSP